MSILPANAADDLYHLGRGTQLEATFFHKQQKFEEAKSRVSGAIEIFEKIGTTFELEKCRNLLQDIQKEPNDPVTAHDLEGDGEFLEKVSSPTLLTQTAFSRPWKV